MEKTIDEVIDDRIGADDEFQKSLESLSDDERNGIIESKRKEVANSIYNELNGKAAESEKNRQAFEDQKIRSKKAEEELKKYKPDDTRKVGELSTKDFYALTKANVPEDDVDDVAEFARFKGISIQDALKSPVMKATLADKMENRKTADATIVRQTRPQNVRPDGSEIAASIKSKGEDAVPEPGSDAAMALFRSRHPNFKE